MGALTKARVFTDRPPEFWLAMGPLFADPKLKRERLYLHDEPDFAWALGLAENRCEAFCAFQVSAGEGCVREFWQTHKPGEIASDSYGLLTAALAHMRAAGAKFVHGRLEQASERVLKKAGFKVVATRGKYIDVEMKL